MTGSPVAVATADGKDRTAARDHTWTTGSGKTVSATVSGGTYAVSIDDLEAFAASLELAAVNLDGARATVVTTQVAVLNAGPPTPLPPHTGPGPAPTWDEFVEEFSTLKANALAAIDALCTGTSSLLSVADDLRLLADDVTQCSVTYANAEDGATASQAELPAWMTVLALLLTGMFPSIALPFLIDRVSKLTDDGEIFGDDFADALVNMQVLLADEDLEQWVVEDLYLLMIIGAWAKKADSGSEAAVFETYVAQASERLDKELAPKLPDVVQVGTQKIPVTELNPTQRVSAYLAMLAGTRAAERYGADYSVTVTPPGGSPVSVPPGTEDPFGLATSVAPLPPAGGAAACIPPLSSASELIRYSDRLKKDDPDESTGVISVVRTDHADGTASWVVVVPGTTDWGLGGTNPQDLLTNLQAVAGTPTDMETAVVTAMRAAGIQEGDRVAMYGHSQGAATAANIVADPVLNERYNFTHLLTAGGPVAGARIPDDVATVHLENSGDSVPALDGAASATGPNRATVTLDTTQAGIDHYPHASSVYAAAVDNMAGSDPALDGWTSTFAQVTGADEEGAVSTAMVFDIKRERNPGGGAVVDGRVE